MQCIRAKFKADLDGLLEFFEKNPLKRKTITDKALKKHFETNFNRFISFGGHAALANVLFTAFQKQEDCLENFDVPRFKEGLNSSEFLRIAKMYSLMTHIVYELCTLNEKDALVALKNVFDEKDIDLQKQKAYFYPTYVKLLLNLAENDPEFYTSCENVFIEEVSSQIKDQACFTSIANLFCNSALRFGREVPNNIIKSERSLACIKRLSFLLPREIVETSIDLKLFLLGHNDIKTPPLKRKKTPSVYLEEYPTQSNKKKRESEMSLKQVWLLNSTKQNDLSKHEEAFVSICSSMEKSILIGKEHDTWCLSDQSLLELESLKTRILNDEITHEKVKEKKRWCVEVLTQKNLSFQGSILKLMVQFLDLWASDILFSHSESTIALLIVKENLSKILLESIIQVVITCKKTDKNLNNIKEITSVFEKSIEYTSDLDQLNSIRERLNKYRKKNTLPTFELEDIWNIDFDTELTLAMNQLTASGEKGMEEQNVNKKLMLISVIWPYKTAAKLIEYSISARDRYEVVVPLMKKMGKLCTSKVTYNFTSFLLPAFQNLAMYSENLQESLFREITLTMRHLLVDNFEDQTQPVILKPRDQTCQLDPFLSENVNMLLATGRDEITQKSFKLGLYILDNFCNFPLEKDQNWTKFLKTLSEESYMSANCLYVGKLFTDLFENMPHWISLEEKEKMLNYTEKLAAYVDEFGARCNWNLGNEPTKLLNALACRGNYESLLLWLDNLPALEECEAVRALNKEIHIFATSDEATMGHWEWILKVFLFSKRKSRETIQTISASNNKLLSIFYDHPYRNNVIKQKFMNILHPKNGFSLTSLYPKLLVDFLGLIFDSITADNTIKSYIYNDIGLKYLINRLQNFEMKQLFTIMYTVELIKDQLIKDPFCTNEYDRHYLSGLAKVLKEINMWKEFCNVECHTSINRLSNTVKDDEKIFNLNAVPDATIQPQRLTDESETLVENKTKEIKAVYYPLLSQDDISKRSLSLLTIIILCSLKVEDGYIRIMISSLVLHIAEGLIYAQAPATFEKVSSSQTKNRISKWKKIKESKIYAILRPTLLDDEKVFMLDILKKLENSDQVLQILESTDRKNSRLLQRGRLYLL